VGDAHAIKKAGETLFGGQIWSSAVFSSFFSLYN
jgi:hypothetical protein